MLQFIGRKRLGSSLLPVVAATGLFMLGLMAHLFTTTKFGDADSPACRAIWMFPSYARLTTFDESHTKLARKYSLHLYREQNVDNIPDDGDFHDSLTGIPVLFIPGNAGSYKQVRSIAAETATTYWREWNEGTLSNKEASHYDFFTADFNEDFTAFHGRTIVDQAEYLNEAIKFILKLYSSQQNPPKSVVLLAHSMGGVVARAMLSLPNYREESVNTILTLATPHALAPLTFDGDLTRVYSAMDRFWYEGYHSNVSTKYSEMARRRVKDVAIVSITGGGLDNTLPADYTTLGYLVPPSNGFTVYTTGIPSVWTPMDHLAIVWCDQLRIAVSRALLNIADKSSPTRTYSLAKKMRALRKTLLSGFEDYSTQDKVATREPETIELKLDSQKIRRMKSGERLRSFKQTEPTTTIFNIPENVNSSFSLLSSSRLSFWEEHRDGSENPSVLLCSNMDMSDSTGREDNKLYELTTENTNEYVALKCVDVKDDASAVPRSFSDSSSVAESSAGGDHSPFYAIQFNHTVLSQFDTIVVVENVRTDENQFLIADLVESSKTKYDLGKGMLNLMRRGADIALPNTRPLAANIYIPGAWSSILIYQVKVHYATKESSTHLPLFAPFIRQWSTEPYETKWHVNVEKNNEMLLTMHGIAPFTPIKIRHDHRYGLNLELWSDPSTEDLPIDIYLSIDFFKSMRLLVLRYRLALVACCLSVTLLSFLFQFNHYIQSNVFPSVIYGLTKICSLKWFPVIFSLLSVLSSVVNNLRVQQFLNLIDPVVLQDSNEINNSLSNDFKLNSFYLGLEEPYLWLIGPIFFMMGVGIILVTYFSLLGVATVISKTKDLFKRPKRGMDSETDTETVNKNKNKNKEEAEESVPMAVSTSFPVRKIVAMILILIAVPFYLPYQFVYVVCCIVQIISTIKLVVAQPQNKSMLNYMITLLILMLWTLPINVPVLIVFIHNFAVNWKTPFSSHHNILAILPILMLMERHSSGNYLPRAVAAKKTNVFITRALVGYFIFYCIIYGIRHTFWLHHLLNVFFCWLLIQYYGQKK
ncbi:GPI inositol-deacylase [[Candida] anglica]|uniref:GPI inositol-deacylase n=1 Tax=[Candida] anglica TaxID=148631 RepID=A0ABP0EIP0_9ASCO